MRKMVVLLVTVGLTSCAQQPKAFGLGNLRDLVPKKPEDVIPIVTGGGAAVACRSLFEKSRDRNIATAVCGSIGVLVGVKLKQVLKEREQAQLAQATDTTLRTRRAQTVKTSEGTTIRTEIIESSPAKRSLQTVTGAASEPPPAEAAASAPAAPLGSDCGTVKQTVITKDGQRFDETVTACKKGDTWTAV